MFESADELSNECIGEIHPDATERKEQLATLDQLLTSFVLWRSEI